MTRFNNAALLTVLAATIAIPTLGFGQSCTTTFTGEPGDPWQVNESWSEQTPGSEDVACIPSDKVALIWNGICNSSQIRQE